MINLHQYRANTFYGFRSRDYERMGADMATVKFEHDFSDALQVRNQLRYGRSTRDSNATPPRFASNDSTVINRELRAWNTEDGIWDNQSDLRANFSTGPIKHAFIAGAGLYEREQYPSDAHGSKLPYDAAESQSRRHLHRCHHNESERWGCYRQYSSVCTHSTP